MSPCIRRFFKRFFKREIRPFLWIWDSESPWIFESKIWTIDGVTAIGKWHNALNFQRHAQFHIKTAHDSEWFSKRISLCWCLLIATLGSWFSQIDQIFYQNIHYLVLSNCLSALCQRLSILERNFDPLSEPACLSPLLASAGDCFVIIWITLITSCFSIISCLYTHLSVRCSAIRDNSAKIQCLWVKSWVSMHLLPAKSKSPRMIMMIALPILLSYKERHKEYKNVGWGWGLEGLDISSERLQRAASSIRARSPIEGKSGSFQNLTVSGKGVSIGIGINERQIQITCFDRDICVWEV